jgi:hypothetical protein
VRLWAVLCPSLALACSDGPTTPGDARGTFRATLGNAIAVNVSGEARHFVFPQESSSIYRVELVSKDAATVFSVTIAGDGTRLPVGSYSIMPGPGASPQAPTVFAVACVNRSTPCYGDWRVATFSNGEAGRLEIVRSAAGGLVGSLVVDLLGQGDFSGQTLHVSAKFNAVCEPPASC